jgi:hypothetical protein
MLDTGAQYPSFIPPSSEDDPHNLTILINDDNDEAKDIFLATYPKDNDNSTLNTVDPDVVRIVIVTQFCVRSH